MFIFAVKCVEVLRNVGCVDFKIIVDEVIDPLFFSTLAICK